MKSVILKILSPYETLEETYPRDVPAAKVTEEFETIFEKMMSKVSPSDAPQMINISGLPGAGKTHVAARMIKENPNQVYIAFDYVMEQLSYYAEEAKEDRKKAYERWEIPARFAGYLLFQKAVEKRLPLLFEHSNANPHHIEFYQAVKKEGYLTEIRFIDAEPFLVMPRLSKRERYFALDRVEERWQLIRKTLPDFKKTVDKFTILGAWRE